MFDKVVVHLSDESDLSDAVSIESDGIFKPYPIGASFNGLDLSVRNDEASSYEVRYRSCLVMAHPTGPAYEARIFYGLPDGDQSESQDGDQSESQHSIALRFKTLGRAMSWIDTMLDGHVTCGHCGH